jgi:hypothetical protein
MQMPSVTLIYDVDCPGADAARDNLRVALHEAGLPVSWREVCRSVDAPVTDGAHVGSPTVLVNGTDVAPGPSPTGRSCRTYVDDDGVRSRVPSAARISASLKAALSASLKASFKAALQAL